MKILSSAPNRQLRVTGTRAAFTLIELVLGMTLLTMLSGAVFGIVRVSMKSASTMQQSEIENDAVNRFIALCRQTFQSLPATAILTLKTTQTGDPALQELTISGAPETFPFGSAPLSYKDTIIGLRPDLDATDASETHQVVNYLALSRQDLIPTEANQSASLSRSSGEGIAAPDDQGRFWMPLLPNVASLNWRCYKDDNEQWLDEWSDTNLPLLVEMNLLLVGRTQPIRVVFAVPLTKLAGPNAALKPPPDPAAGAAGVTAGAAGANGRGGKNAKPGQKGTATPGKGGKGAPGGKGSKGGRGGPPGGAGQPQQGTAPQPNFRSAQGGAPAAGAPSAAGGKR